MSHRCIRSHFVQRKSLSLNQKMPYNVVGPISDTLTDRGVSLTMPNVAPFKGFNPFSRDLAVEHPRVPEHAVRPVSPAQVRGARAMLHWSMLDLAKAARVSVSTVKRFEDGQSAPVSRDMVSMLRDALEIEGVQFLPDDRHGPGVRLRLR